MVDNDQNRDSMDKEEIKQIAYDFTTGKGDAKKLEDRILSLFPVSCPLLSKDGMSAKAYQEAIRFKKLVEEDGNGLKFILDINSFVLGANYIIYEHDS